MNRLLFIFLAGLGGISCGNPKTAPQPTAFTAPQPTAFTAPQPDRLRPIEPETPLYTAYQKFTRSNPTKATDNIFPVFIYRGVRFIGCGAELRDSGCSWILTAAHLLGEPVPCVYSYRRLDKFETEIPIAGAILPFGASDIAVLYPGSSQPIRGIACFKWQSQQSQSENSAPCVSTVTGRTAILEYKNEDPRSDGVQQGALWSKRFIDKGGNPLAVFRWV